MTENIKTAVPKQEQSRMLSTTCCSFEIQQTIISY